MKKLLGKAQEILHSKYGDKIQALVLESWLIDYLESIQYLYNKYDVVEEIKHLIISTWYEKNVLNNKS